ncbi:MAG TPA: glycosyltransferase [Polyangia bacterium]|nr:glycosyltransferase [Polyangia bacterium]
MSRLLLVGARPPPTGGVATHLDQLRRALVQRGVEVTALDPRRRGPDGRDGRPRLILMLAHHAGRGNLVHVHTNGHNRKSWLLAAACSLPSGGRRALLTLHSGLAPAFMRSHQQWVRILCNRFTYVIAVNAELAAALAEAGVDPARVVLCPAFSPTGQELRLSPPGLRAVRRRHPMLLAAALAPGREYGADVLLDAFSMMRVHHERAGLMLYGPGTRSPQLAREVARRGLDGAVHLWGELDRPRALALVESADVFVRPTRADGDALSVREALALGVPVVASAVGTRPPETRLFPAGDARALAAALVETIFRAVGNPGGQKAPPTSADDCLPTLMALYRRCGLEIAAHATTGTPLATAS